MYNPSQNISSLKGDEGGANEQSYITPSAMGGSVEVQSITCPAFASAAQGDYVVLSAPNGNTLAIWLDKDANGTAPTGAGYVASTTKKKASIVTGDTAALVKAAVIAAGNGFEGWTLTSGGTAIVTCTQSQVGNAAAPAVHNTDDTGDGSLVVATVTGGTAPSVQGKYFTFANTSTSYYGWFSSGGNGSDPAPGGTGVQIALDGDESNSEYLAAISAAIDGTSGFTSEVDGSRIIVSVDAEGAATDLGAGDSGFSVEVKSQGYAGVLKPSSLVGSLSINPSTIS